MNNYILFTKDEDFIRYQKRLIWFFSYPMRALCVILILIATIMLSPFLLTKNARKEWGELFVMMKDFRVKKGSFEETSATYDGFLNDVAIGLESYNGLNEDSILYFFANSIAHEDIHKCLRNHTGGGQEFIIKKMLYD